VLEKHELLPGYEVGYSYKTGALIARLAFPIQTHQCSTVVTVNTPVYLVWLQRQVEALGGRLYRARLANWSDVLQVIPASVGLLPNVVINCTGNGARTLGGVQDFDCYPTRGQTVLVRCPGFRKSLTLVGGRYPKH
jgi:hypothetical protein